MMGAPDPHAPKYYKLRCRLTWAPPYGSMTFNGKNNVAPPCLGEALRRVTIAISTFIVPNFHGLSVNTLVMPIFNRTTFSLFLPGFIYDPRRVTIIKPEN